MRKYLIPLAFLASLAILLIFKIAQGKTSWLKIQPFSQTIGLEKPTSTPTLTPTPTPRPLTFEEMQALYGPCVIAPTLYYHHIQDEKEAKENQQSNLSLNTEYFKEQMQYLKDKGYTPISMQDLVSFFDNDVKLQTKPVLITFDDGYEDLYENAFPLLKELNFKATVFLPTGVVDNPGYLTWEQIAKTAKSGLIFFANHTWSHHSVVVSKDVVEWEIATADMQLAEKGLNSPKVFAYPYGDENSFAKEILKKLNYSLAFTTRYARTLCKGQRLDLPRIRIGNTPLSAYGL